MKEKYYIVTKCEVADIIIIFYFPFLLLTKPLKVFEGRGLEIKKNVKEETILIFAPSLQSQSWNEETKILESNFLMDFCIVFVVLQGF